jgi:hypothetical protein
MNFKNLILLSVVILFISCSKDLDDSLSVDKIFNEVNAISADSDLFNNLIEVSSNSDKPNETIACINFIYPITLFVFNENNEYQSTTTISNDDEFSNFLDPIVDTYSISISFPITSALSSGEELIIENKEELEESINNCLDVEMVGECVNLIRECLWKIGYSFEYDNLYLGNLLQETDGFLTMYTQNNIIAGSWTPFVIENELHININLIDTTDVGDYFNLDWKAEYIDDNSLRLSYEDKELILNQRCDPDFDTCSNFEFTACETELDSGFAEFILNDYEFCILDTLELDSEEGNISISFYNSEDDAINMINAISPNEPYTNSEPSQIIYVRIENSNEDNIHFVEIILNATSC